MIFSFLDLRDLYLSPPTRLRMFDSYTSAAITSFSLTSSRSKRRFCDTIGGSGSGVPTVISAVCSLSAAALTKVPVPAAAGWSTCACIGARGTSAISDVVSSPLLVDAGSNCDEKTVSNALGLSQDSSRRGAGPDVGSPQLPVATGKGPCSDVGLPVPLPDIAIRDGEALDFAALADLRCEKFEVAMSFYVRFTQPID